PSFTWGSKAPAPRSTVASSTPSCWAIALMPPAWLSSDPMSMVVAPVGCVAPGLALGLPQPQPPIARTDGAQYSRVPMTLRRSADPRTTAARAHPPLQPHPHEQRPQRLSGEPLLQPCGCSD